MKKLLIWDGDESLWCGTVVDESAAELPNGRYEFCAELKRRGVVQSVASFNLQQDVDAMLHKFNLDNFFVASIGEFGVNKSTMVATIMADLNLAKASDVVFIDDQEFNREEVKAWNADIIVIDPEVAIWQDLLDDLFHKDRYTDDDGKRVAMYKADQIRKVSGESYGGDKLAFLRSCELKMEIFYPEGDDYVRVVDLIKRANRMSAAGPDVFLDDGSVDESNLQELSLYAIRCKDKFGDYGLSGVIGISEETYGVGIELLVMSCRLQGKGYGSALLGSVLNMHVGTHVRAHWQETDYNAGVRSLYEWYGFEFHALPGDVIRGAKLFNDSVELPDWIEVIYA